MFRQLKGLFRKEEEQLLAFSFEEIPEWISSERDRLKSIEQENVDASREKILAAIEKLKELVNYLGSAEHKDEVHPKLEKVVENSLPLYKKAMITALSRQFPENPDGFYTSVTECLKGCVKSLSGPGRYLVGVFPEEMKAIKTAIDQIGRQVNAMNPKISEGKKMDGQLRKISDLHISAIRSLEQLRHAEKEYPDVVSRVDILGSEVDVLSEMIAGTVNDPRMKNLEALSKEKKEFIERMELANREFSSYQGMIIHVLKRAEKVAQKDRKLSLAKRAHTLTDHLSKNEIPVKSELIEELVQVLPDIITMVSVGEITLKNKDEVHYFSDPIQLPDKLNELYERIGQIEMGIEELRFRSEKNTFNIEKEGMERRYRAKISELDRAERKRSEEMERINLSKKEIPATIKSIEEEMTAFSGNKIKITPPVDLLVE